MGGDNASAENATLNANRIVAEHRWPERRLVQKRIISVSPKSGWKIDRLSNPHSAIRHPQTQVWVAAVGQG
jgi:hypothetical protein